MSGHTIKLADVEDYELHHSIASCVGARENKDLSAVVKGNTVRWVVTNNRKEVLSTTSISEAVAEYNNC